MLKKKKEKRKGVWEHPAFTWSLLRRQEGVENKSVWGLGWGGNDPNSAYP